MIRADDAGQCAHCRGLYARGDILTAGTDGQLRHPLCDGKERWLAAEFPAAPAPTGRG